VGCDWFRLDGETNLWRPNHSPFQRLQARQRCDWRKGEKDLLVPYLSLQCSDWLADTVEAASLSQGKEEFAKSFRENGKALIVHKGCNKSSCFLVAAVFAEGGRRVGIWFPKGCEGWCW
jgi:hypothetical protein